MLDGASKGSEESKKTSKKAKEAKGVTDAPDDNMQATFQADLEKAKSATKNTKDVMTTAATKIFANYANLFSVIAKYVRNKIVEEQM